MAKSADFNVTIATADVTAEPRGYALLASDATLEAVKERLSLVSIASFSANVEVVYEQSVKALKVFGRIQSELAQACVVTLDPVPETIDDTFELLLVSPEQADQFDEDELYLDPSFPDYDGLETDRIDLGEIAVQTLSIMMSEYPRKEGVELSAGMANGAEVNEELAKKPNPFAALSKLRDES